MKRYNLLDEPWIKVVSKSQGEQTEISLLDLFHHAENYLCLAGEMETQNFAMLRFLLAILQTVFSRFDSNGEPYPFIELNEKMQQINEVDCEDEEEYDDYSEARETCWNSVWKTGRFPEIICKYLEEWRDHFYLYDDVFPFYQVTEKEMRALIPTGKKPTEFSGRNLNRLISESGNKPALFSPIVSERKEAS